MCELSVVASGFPLSGPVSYRQSCVATSRSTTNQRARVKCSGLTIIAPMLDALSERHRKEILQFFTFRQRKRSCFKMLPLRCIASSRSGEALRRNMFALGLADLVAKILVTPWRTNPRNSRSEFSLPLRPPRCGRLVMVSSGRRPRRRVLCAGTYRHHFRTYQIGRAHV